ncbi:MAG: hypothetical protein IPH24_01030 [Crocinitomicaceae bacterium]|nr:hypothetical protein [Crocinitomicaceae bacterium]
MKFLIPFSVILFCSCNSSQNTDVAGQNDTVTFDSIQPELPVQDSAIDYGVSGYSHLLEIISEYSFDANLTSTYDEAMEWLSDEGLEVSSAYSEEESHYNIDFEIRSTNEDASCAFHFEYSSDGEYSTYRHIIINVQEDLKSAFIEELKVWYSGALELQNI